MNNLYALKNRLDRACELINTPAFVADDPVQFPRRYSRPADIEIAALLSAVIAWGCRPQILKDCERLLAMAEGEPLRWLLDGAWEQLPARQNIHRTCFASHLQYLLRGLRSIYRRYPSLEAFAVAAGSVQAEAPAWHLVEAMGRVMLDENGGSCCPEVLPSNLRSTALKRYNMALRWLVRRDGIVDIGLWQALTPARLFIPLDVHVATTSRSLGLLERKSNDRRAVEMLTARLREFCPEDPVKYDFALFGLGVSGSSL